MSRCLYFIFCIAFLLTVAQPVLYAQSQRKVSWQALTGTKGELTILIPEGYESFAASEFYVQPRIYVRNRLTVLRYINGTVLMMDYFEGDGKKLMDEITAKQKVQPNKTDSLNGFTYKSFVIQNTDLVIERDFYLKDNRLYILQAFHREEKNPVASDFLESVKTADSKQASQINSALNGKTGVLVRTLPPIIEQTVENVSNVEEKPTKAAIIVYSPPVRFPYEYGRGNATRIKFKLLLNAIGKVERVETASGFSFAKIEAAKKSAERVYFLPAIKDDKPVTSWKEFQYSLEFVTY